MDSSVRHVVDRRLSNRTTAVAELGIRRAKIRPGHDASVVDISARGVLIETAVRLMPGRQIELQIERGTQMMPIRGRVVRSQVAGVQPSRMSYRGAIGFEQPLAWLAAPAGCDQPAIHRTSDGARVRA